ncbi:hypothetical protein Golomagni_07845 [Golovinomyces magnicellulatus]|nr:hypothetical protein Golomagni_07845 [Golovinomyces magnicellulatus]
MPFTCSDIVKIILAIFLPPLGVFLERGCGASRKDSLSSRHADICLGSLLLILPANSDFWINVLLTILGYLPGIIHALYIIFKY